MWLSLHLDHGGTTVTGVLEELLEEVEGLDLQAAGVDTGMADDVLAAMNGLIEADGDLVLELQNALEENKKQLSETESRLKSGIEEVASLGRELEISRNLLHESQVRHRSISFVHCMPPGIILSPTNASISC